MKKKLYLIIGAVFTGLIVLFATLGFLTSKIPTRSALLKVTSTNPNDGATNVTPDTPITISFNKKLDQKNIRFNVTPKIDGSSAIEGNNYVFKPSSPLSTSTMYFISLDILDRNPSGIFVFSFLTVGPPLPKPNSAESPAFLDSLEKKDRQNFPDIFLTNKTPYSNDNFSITSTFTKTPKEHFYFTVTLKGDKTKSKEAFVAWLKSLELTDSQISSLDIRYQ